MARNAARIGCVPMMSRARSNISIISCWLWTLFRQSTDLAPRLAELRQHPAHQGGRRRVGIGMLVFKIHRLPLERAKLVERLDLDPLDVLHRRDEFGDALDIRRIVRQAG